MPRKMTPCCASASQSSTNRAWCRYPRAPRASCGLICCSEGRSSRFIRTRLFYAPDIAHRCALTALFKAAGVRDDQGKLPRIHDLRHTFAVQALIRWYKEGADVQSNLPKLALYMGHVSIESSAYYLHWVPSLRSLARQRFEQKFGRLVEGGAR